jgi:hypothetical protein
VAKRTKWNRPAHPTHVLLRQSYSRLMSAIDRDVTGPPFEVQRRGDVIGYSFGGSYVTLTQGTAEALASFLRVLADELRATEEPSCGRAE